jgi:hypothetical protein
MSHTFHHIHVTGAQHAPNHNHDFQRVLDDEERSIHTESSILNPAYNGKGPRNIGLGCSLRQQLTPPRFYTFPPGSYWMRLKDLQEADAFLIWIPWFDYFNQEWVQRSIEGRFGEVAATGKPYGALLDITLPRRVEVAMGITHPGKENYGRRPFYLTLDGENRTRFVQPTDDEAAAFARRVCPDGPHAVIDFDAPNEITRHTVDALAWWCLLFASPELNLDG